MPIDNNYNREILTIKLEKGVPISVDWSPDGTRLAMGDSFNGIEVVTAEGKRLWRREEHSNKIYCARWAPNGFLIASASYDKTVLLYDADTGKIILRGNAGFGNNQVTWSPDSTRLAWAVEGENQSYCVRIFDAVTGQSLINCNGSALSINCVLWSPKGNILASGSEDYNINLFDSISGSCLYVLEGHHDFVDDLCWSPDGSLLASASNDHTIRTWNTSSGKCISFCKGHEGCVDSINWSPDGRLIASGSGDNSARLWYAADLTELLKINHSDWVNAVAFSPDGSRLATACSDGCLRLFDISDFVHTKNEAALNAALKEYIALQAATIGIPPPVFKRKAPWVPHLPEADGDCLGALRCLNTKGSFPSVALFPTGRSIVTGHSDSTVRRWDLQTGAILWQGNKKHSEKIADIAISPDGASIATASEDKLVRTWDAQTGQFLKQLQGHRNLIENIRWSPDGKHLASIEYSIEKQLRTWDADTGQCLWIGEGHTERAIGLDWSPAGRFIATGDDSGNIIIWDAVSRKNAGTFNIHNNLVWGLRWSPDSRFLLTSFKDGTVLVVNPFEGSILFRLQGHTDAVSALDWSRDDRFIATGARNNDKTMRVWDAETGQELKCFTFPEDGCFKLAFSPDSAFIVASLGVSKKKKWEDVFRLWDIRNLPKNKTAKTVTIVEPSLDKPLPEHLKHLPPALAQVHRLNIYPPLSLVRDMLDLLANRCTVESLQTLLNQNGGIQALRDLHWPFAARIGLVTLLLHNYPPSEWKPPSGISPSQVRDALFTALSWEYSEPQPPAPPISLLMQTTEMIDDRLLSLLTMLGPDAVAADPGLPLRLLPRVKEIPPLSIRQRRQLGLRINTPGSGQSTGLAPGVDRSQIGDIQMGPLRSDFTSLLPTQLALPPQVQMYRHLRNELLFRAREMAEPPRLRPAVILLDVSPPTFGPIEKIIRLAAFTIAQSLHRAGLSTILLTNSDGFKESQWLLELKNPADLVEIWLQRTLKSIPACRSLELARVLRAGMQENNGLEPIILVLSHPWYGAEEDIPLIKHMRGLFVQYPHYPAIPILAGKCEKWKTIETTKVNDLTSILAHLMT